MFSGSPLRHPFNQDTNNEFSESTSSMDTADETAAFHVDNSKAVIFKIEKLYKEKLLNDVVLVVNGVEFPSHRLILSSSSPVFRAMLMSGNWTEFEGHNVHLVESASCAIVFEQFLRYLYTGQVELKVNDVIHLLTLSDKYNVKDLMVLCQGFMENHIPGATAANQLISWFQYATISAHSNLAKMCRDYIKWNIEAVAKTSDFKTLDCELFWDILKDDDIGVLDEYRLFSCVEKWLIYQSNNFPNYDESDSEEQLFEIVRHTLSYVRFPMMRPRQLADLLLLPLTQKYKELLMDFMSISMTFHSGEINKLRSLLDAHPFPSKLFTPRLYTADTWSIGLRIQSISSFTQYTSYNLVFSTPISLREGQVEKQTEWVVDFYPKGVYFQKYRLIRWHQTIECPESVLQTVRLAVRCKNEEEDDPIRALISVLVSGFKDGVESIQSVSQCPYIFSRTDNVLNMDHIVKYNQITQCAYCKRQNVFTTRLHGGTARSNASPPQCSLESACGITCVSARNLNPVLIGDNNDELKIRIVITPNNEIKGVN